MKNFRRFFTLLSRLDNSNFGIVIGIAIVIFFTISYSILLLHKYWQFEFFYTDNVYFDSALWKVSQFQAPIVRHNLFGEINILGDHFHPTIFLFSLLYWLTSKQEVILFGMSLVYGISAFIGLMITWKLTKSTLVAVTLLFDYFLYMGTQNAMIYGFHELNLMPLFFMLTLSAIFFQKWRLYWISLLLLLLTKETMAVVTFCIGIFMFFEFRDKRKIAFLTLIVSVIYYFAVTNYVIPGFTGKFLYNQFESINNIYDVVDKLINPREKLSTFFVSLSSFGFLPLLNPATLPLVLEDFLIRYLFGIRGNVQYRLFYHYNLVLAPILFFASVWTIRKWKLRKKFYLFIPIMILTAFLFTIYYHRFSPARGPLLLVFNRDFYQVTKNNAFLWELVEKTPRDGRIMTQNHLAYAFSHDDVYLFPTYLHELRQINPKYIVYDIREGQNPNNHFPISSGLIEEFANTLIKSGEYQVYFQKNTMNILKKKNVRID